METIVLDDFGYDKDRFMQCLDELRDKMEERGLTEEILNDILKDEL